MRQRRSALLSLKAVAEVTGAVGEVVADRRLAAAGQRSDQDEAQE